MPLFAKFVFVDVRGTRSAVCEPPVDATAGFRKDMTLRLSEHVLRHVKAHYGVLTGLRFEVG